MEKSTANINSYTGNLLPLAVDLDGTLFTGDLLYESFLEFLKGSGPLMPIAFLQAVFQLLIGGRVGLKRFLATRTSIDIEELPYREDILSYVKSQKSLGRSVFLVSASDELYVKKIATFLGCFDEGIGSNGTINLLGKAKAKYIVERFGEKGFDYIGDTDADLHVWKHSSSGVSAGTEELTKMASAVTKITETFPVKRNTVPIIIRGIRVHQWVKNLLLFVPLFGAHKFLEIDRLMQVFLGFLSFSFLASSVYLTNDLIDINSDRKHPKKKKRPIAAGTLSLSYAFILTPILLALGFTTGYFVSKDFFGILFIYFIITTLYSFYLKKVPLLDIILLASLYTIRIVAGTYAANVYISKWLIAFSMFIFFSLACVKRYSELQLMRSLSREKAEGRGYRSSDMEQIGIFGTISGYIAILVSTLYITSDEVATLYKNPEILWFICPILFYWISRVWLLASRGDMHEDPIVFALRDKTSYIIGAVSAVIVLSAAMGV